MGEKIENMTYRKAMVFLSKELGFNRIPSNTQDLVELSLAILQQGKIEFTEEEWESINISIRVEDGLEVKQGWWSEDDE